MTARDRSTPTAWRTLRRKTGGRTHAPRFCLRRCGARRWAENEIRPLLRAHWPSPRRLSCLEQLVPIPHLRGTAVASRLVGTEWL